MSDIKRDINFDMNGRIINATKQDYKNNKKSLKIFEFFTQFTSSKTLSTDDILNNLFGLDENNDKTISKDEIKNFIEKIHTSDKKYIKAGDKKVNISKLKDISEEDLYEFFDDLLDKNPLNQKEYNSRQLHKYQIEGLSDDAIDEISEKESITIEDYSDNGKVKQGYELFDLNGDGEIDDKESKFWGNLNISNKTPDNIYEKLDILDKIGSTDNTSDKVITSDDKKKYYYKDAIEKYNRYTSEILDNSIMTKEAAELFANNNYIVKFEDLFDENGKLKKGMELFDIDNNGILDESEKAFFSNGGQLYGESKNTINLEDFVQALEQMDLFDLKEDSKLNDADKKQLYTLIQASYVMFDSFEKIDKDLADLYKKALKEISQFSKNDALDCDGSYNNGNKLIKVNCKNKNEAALILAHELTHHICSTMHDKKVNLMAQEVEAFYVEYQLSKHMPKYAISKNLREALDEYDILENTNPEISSLDIAKQVFKMTRLNSYKKRYKEYLETEKLDAKDAVENGEYYDINGFFTEKSNKKQIYEASIKKAFNGLHLKDENGNELITDAVINLFSADKPIITYDDLLDENGKLKKGLELFDFGVNGTDDEYALRKYFKYISYNDVERLVYMLDGLSFPEKNDTDNIEIHYGKLLRERKKRTYNGISTTEERKYIGQELIYTGLFQRKADYHKF